MGIIKFYFIFAPKARKNRKDDGRRRQGGRKHATSIGAF